MRRNHCYRLVGAVTFVAVCAAAHAQITVSGNPNLYQSDYVENFQEFVSQGTVPLTPTNVGLLTGVPIFNQNAAISMTNPGDGTSLATYSPYSGGPDSAWGLAGGGYAGTYNGLPQGLGFQNTTTLGTADITISLQSGMNDEYFGGYFQAAYYNTPQNMYASAITFSFYDGTSLVESLTEEPNASGANSTDLPLVGYAFTFASGYSFTSVQISGEFVAMGSLRIAATPQTVPEPAPFAVMGLGLGALALLRRRR